jgi:hypothetical protein
MNSQWVLWKSMVASKSQWLLLKSLVAMLIHWLLCKASVRYGEVTAVVESGSYEESVGAMEVIGCQEK